jgi:hypothetical protein
MADAADKPLSELTVAELAKLWLREKAVENDAIERRRQIGNALLAKIEAPASGEGTTHPEIPGFKTTVTYGLKREIDDAISVDDLRQKLPEQVFDDLVRFKAEVNVTALKEIRDRFPEAWDVIVANITTKPSSPQIKLEPIDGGLREEISE